MGAGQKARLVAEIVALYARVRWLLARRELPDVVASLRRGSRRPAPPAAEEAVRLGRWYGGAVMLSLGRLPFDARCLVRSLVLLGLLARRGIETRLVIGVRTRPDFSAHAWVEHGSAALLPPGEMREGRLVEL